MSNVWQKAHTELTDFVAEHSEIEIGASRVRIPESVRPEFYRLFNTVRTAFIEEKVHGLLNEGRLLSENYLKAEHEVVRVLGLEDVSMEADLLRFLHDPINQLIRGLFGPLFDLLKGRIGIEKFEATASKNIEASSRILYIAGYEKWIALSLIKLFEADKLFQTTPREFATDEEEVIMRASSPEEPVPAPQESKRLLFKYEATATLTVPDLIVYSAKVNRYIATRSQIGEAFGTTTDTGDKMEWYPLDSVVTLESGLTLVYMADDPKEISLVADAQKICRPDFIIECREQKDWFEKEGLERVRLHHNSLKPKLGTYIVSKETVQEQDLEELGVGIHILTVGFDSSKLAPIVNSINNGRG